MATKVVIKDVIGSYVYLREARENQNGEKDYSMQIILPKNHPQVEQIKKAITEVAKEHFGEKIKLSMLKIPLRDGDTEKDTPEYQNCYFFNAKAKKQPQIVNKYNEFASEKDLDDYCYSGATFCVSVNFYAFDKNGNRGVSAALNAVMLRKLHKLNLENLQKSQHKAVTLAALMIANLLTMAKILIFNCHV